MKKKNRLRLGPTVAFAALGLLPSVAHAADYDFCMRAIVQNVDSSKLDYTGATEDYYLSGTPVNYRARGIYVEFFDSSNTYLGWVQTDLAGCGTITVPGSGTQSLRVRAFTYSKPGNGNELWVHDGQNSTSYLPGWVYAWDSPLVSMSSTSQTQITIPYMTQFSMFVTASWVMYAVNQGVSGKFLMIGSSNNDGSTAHYGNYGARLSQGDAFVHINSGQVALKFVIAHEIGHAFAMLYRGVNDTTLDNTPLADLGFFDSSSRTQCQDTTATYGRGTLEWNTVNNREGFADFYATRVFNNRDQSDAVFTINGSGISAATWGNCTPDTSGGRTNRYCYSSGTATCTVPPGTHPNGVSTIQDWLRFYWDVFTQLEFDCSDRTNFSDMLALYKSVRDLAPSRTQMESTVLNQIAAIPQFGTCHGLESAGYASHNGM